MSKLIKIWCNTA